MGKKIKWGKIEGEEGRREGKREEKREETREEKREEREVNGKVRYWVKVEKLEGGKGNQVSTNFVHPYY